MIASGAGRHGWAPTNSANMYGGGGVWVCACVYVCVLAHACARMRAHVYLRDVFAIYDHNILPRLIMIITKIIILYFIQIRHTIYLCIHQLNVINTNLLYISSISRV